MKILIVPVVLSLGACAGGQMPPEWQLQSHASLERFTQQYLEGSSQPAQRSFAEVKAAMASTGRPELAARAELVRCALGTAALDVDACVAYESARADATAEDRVYGDFVTGQMRGQDASKLPAQYRGVATARDEVTRNKAMQEHRGRDDRRQVGAERPANGQTCKVHSCAQAMRNNRAVTVDPLCSFLRFRQGLVNQVDAFADRLQRRRVAPGFGALCLHVEVGQQRPAIALRRCRVDGGDQTIR